MELKNFTIKQAHEGLKKKEFSAVELAKEYLKKIKETDGEIGAFLSVTKDSALKQAEHADEVISRDKDFNLLTGIPCAVKDNILIEGEKCTAASKMLENYVASYDATAIKRLKEKGAVILGKTNLDEFAFGSSTENSALKVTRNPVDKTRVPGGSSGGSAATVASNQAVFALGSDTGCSIRTPASFCGIAGLKTTYGSVSRYGLIASASSLDQIGPLAKNVEDIETIFEVISGKDKMDATTAEYSYEKASEKKDKIKIGVPKQYFGKGLDAEVERLIKGAIEKSKELGCDIVEIDLPSVEYALACYYIIQTSESSTNLARFDGIRYGLSKDAENLAGVYSKSREGGLGLESKRRIMLGTYSLSSGYYDAYYKKANEVKQLVKNDFKKAFKGVDLICGPVVPFPAFKIGEKFEDPLAMYLADIYTVPVNLAGNPGLSLPVGKTKDGLPVGLQIIGNHFEENKILAIAGQLEKLI